MKRKYFCAVKEMICGQNRQSPEWEKTLTSYTPHTLLATRIYNLHKLSSMEIKLPINKWANINWMVFKKKKKKKEA